MDSKTVIREIRQKLKLTQEEFGGQIGVKQGAVANYETGRRIPEVPIARKIEQIAQTNGMKYTISDILP